MQPFYKDKRNNSPVRIITHTFEALTMCQTLFSVLFTNINLFNLHSDLAHFTDKNTELQEINHFPKVRC